MLFIFLLLEIKKNNIFSSLVFYNYINGKNS